MPEVKDSEQTQWVRSHGTSTSTQLTGHELQRVEEIGYDRQGCYYFVLDDNRLYRRTDPPPPPPPASKPKAKSKKGKAAARSSKRRKTNDTDMSANDADVETTAENEEKPSEEDDGFGGWKWECIAISLSQYQAFLESIQKSKHPDEKALHQRITQDVLPVIEKVEESQLRKKQKQERELMNMQKLATAKRSSRLEAKMERERQEQEVADAERKREEDLAAAKRDLEKQKNMEAARESRMMTREQRLKDREYKRILHEEELANLSEENKKVDAGESRMSERHLKAEMEKRRKELAALAEDDEWVFDCSKCGVHGTNLVSLTLIIWPIRPLANTCQDDGSHSVACEKCNVWQHSACLGISQEAAEKEDFHFLCWDCKRREEDAKKPKIPSLKFHIGSSSSPPSQKPKPAQPTSNETLKRKPGDGITGVPPSKKFKIMNTNRPAAKAYTPRPSHDDQNGMHATVMNGPSLSPQGQVQPYLYAGNAFPPGASSPPPTAPGYTNNYGRPMPQPRGHKPHIPNQTHQPSYPASGYYPNQASFQSYQYGYSSFPASDQRPQSSYQPPNTGWSARYTPPHATPPNQPSGPPPPSQNPFANSFDTQRPLSSHAPHNIPPPIRNGPSLSPPQQSHLNMAPGPSQTPQTNAYTRPSPISALPPQGPPAFSPTKHPSPPTARLMQPPSSSPVAHQPPFQPNASPSPGFSPTKQSPPHPAASPAANTLQPPSPSPVVHQPPFQPNAPPSLGFSPTKQSPPHPAASPTANALQPPSSSPVAHQPPLQPTAPPSPGFSPTKRSPPRSAAPGHAISGASTVLPPVAHLSPSATQQAPQAPIKETNGHSEAQ